MARYRLRPVVVDERVGNIVHYGPIAPLKAADIEAARAEVDSMLPLSSGNCLQILNEDDSVATHLMLGKGKAGSWH